MTKAHDEVVAKIRVDVVSGDQSWRETVVERSIAFWRARAAKTRQRVAENQDGENDAEMREILDDILKMADEEDANAEAIAAKGSVISPENAEIALRLNALAAP